jgi:RNA polymerase sigma-70 factor (ECF subfamily)
MKSEAPDTPSTDMSLLERVAQNDNEAWERFVEIYTPVVLYWCKRQGLREADCEDVFQDVSRALLTSLSNFRKEAENQQFRRYLWKVTRSKIQELRRRAEQAISMDPLALSDFDRHLHELDEEEQSRNAPSAILLLREVLKQVAKRVREPKSLEMFNLLIVEGRSVAEVARQFHMNENAVRRTRSRLRKMIRQEFEEFLPPD